MNDQFSRCTLIYGDEGITTLQHTHVAVFGLGGVGGHVVESLVRTGVGTITIVDHDTVDITNLNRQIIATHKTLGMKKTDAFVQRINSINPACHINAVDCFYLPETANEFNLSEFDYIVDAVDTVQAKLELVSRATTLHVPIISALGAGNKTDPTALHIADIYQTSICPLARIMRKELRKRGIEQLTVCYSTEPPIKTLALNTHELSRAQSNAETHTKRSPTPGSNAFVPAAMGLTIAAHVVNTLTKTSA